ncbi:hypothetical protein I4U23_023067 [Adineta vaga]|nr:hypothetical protein I4U23_023067 [Adineta vaga]
MLTNESYIDDIHLTKEILRKFNDYVVMFDKESECLTYINSIENETILLIVAGSCATTHLLVALHTLQQVD